MSEIEETDSPAEREQTELEALTDLLSSDGWLRFQAFIEQEWGAEAYARKIDQAIVAAKNAGHSAEGDICEIGAAARAVRIAAQWPAKRLAEIRGSRRKATGLFRRRA